MAVIGSEREASIHHYMMGYVCPKLFDLMYQSGAQEREQSPLQECNTNWMIYRNLWIAPGPADLRMLSGYAEYDA